MRRWVWAIASTYFVPDNFSMQLIDRPLIRDRSRLPSNSPGKHRTVPDCWRTVCLLVSHWSGTLEGLNDHQLPEVNQCLQTICTLSKYNLSIVRIQLWDKNNSSTNIPRPIRELFTDKNWLLHYLRTQKLFTDPHFHPCTRRTSVEVQPKTPIKCRHTAKLIKKNGNRY